MKKTSILITTALVIVATAVAVVSCKKEKPQQTNDTEQCLQNSDNMDEYLMSFKKKLLSAEKGGETISLEQAERDLGNLLNFDFGDANYATNVFQQDTLRASLVLSNGQVELSRLATTYQTLLDEVQNTYQQVNLPEKSVYTISCVIDDKRKDDAAEVVAILTTRAYEEPDEPINDWRAGNKAGRCDGYMVNIWGAPEEVMNMLRTNMGVGVCPNGTRMYYTDVSSRYKDAYEPDLNDTLAPHGHKLFYRWGVEGVSNVSHYCVPHEDIVYYYNVARMLPSTNRESFHPSPIPSNHHVLNYFIYYLEKTESGIIKGYWHYVVEHGKPNCTGSSSPAV